MREEIEGVNLEEEILATLTRLRQARRILDEIAAQGNWKVSEVGQYSAIYQKVDGGRVEELEVLKKADMQWQVVKRVKGVKIGV